MKKRKKPILLVAVFVMLFAVVAAMNSSLLSTPKTAAELEAAEAMRAAEEARKNAPPTQVAAQPTAPNQPLVEPLDQDAGDMPMNVTPRPAIAKGASLITAPTARVGKQKPPDRAKPGSLANND